jgi:Putative porin
VNRIARSLQISTLTAAAAAALAIPTLAEEKEEPTLSEIVNILHERGLLDDDQHANLAAKAAKEQAKRSWTERFSIFGDLRGRFEAFQFDQDIYTKSAGARLQDRYRARYRARLGVNAEVASRASVTLALASGGADPRSANQTLGSGNDFDKDEFRIDLAYATISPFPKGELPGIEKGYLAFDIGKVKNPFVWKQLSVDNLLFDNDINPEGANLRISGGAGPLLLFANGGIYVIDENAAAKDPKLAGAQVGATLELTDSLTVGARGSIYHFFSLDDDFFARGAFNVGAPGGTAGNIIDGLSRRNGSIQVAEGSAFVNIDLIDLLPVQFFGTYSNNLSARPSLVTNAKSEGDAWAVGVFVGDKARLLRVGFGYYYIEANAFPSMYIDSDVLDGVTNREGYAIVIERQLLENVDLSLKGYKSNRIEGGTAFVNSGPGANRLRGQADVVFKF